MKRPSVSWRHWDISNEETGKGNLKSPSREQIDQKLLEWRWRHPATWWYEVRRRGGRRYELRWSWYEDITPDLAEEGVEIRPYRIDVDRFWRWIETCGYRELPYFNGGELPNATSKWLEHFVSLELTQPQPGERLVDIASAASPFPDVVRQHHGLEVFKQDIAYPDGVSEYQIGGNAASMPVDDGFADIMTLHCSFEHFEGDSDSRFVREAGRVLRPGGRLCILPFYTHSTYSIQTDPATWETQSVEFEPEALICLARGWGEIHGRSYDAEHFLSRIAPNLGELQPTIYAVENYLDIHPDAYLKFALVLTRP